MRPSCGFRSLTTSIAAVNVRIIDRGQIYPGKFRERAGPAASRHAGVFEAGCSDTIGVARNDVHPPNKPILWENRLSARVSATLLWSIPCEKLAASQAA